MGIKAAVLPALNHAGGLADGYGLAGLLITAAQIQECGAAGRGQDMQAKDAVIPAKARHSSARLTSRSTPKTVSPSQTAMPWLTAQTTAPVYQRPTGTSVRLEAAWLSGWMPATRLRTV